jgi:ATP-dependent RNA helicase DeaD
MLYSIERATRQKVEEYRMPSTADINDRRVDAFKQRIQATLEEDGLEVFAKMIEQFESEHEVPAQEIAAALAKMVQGDTPLLLAESKRSERKPREDKRSERSSETSERPQRERRPANSQAARSLPRLERGMERFRLDVGSDHDVQKGNVVGAVANESGIENEFIGHIEIYDQYTTIDLPEGMPNHILQTLQEARIMGRKMQLKREEMEDFSHDRKERIQRGRGSSGGRSSEGRRGGGDAKRGGGRGAPRARSGGRTPPKRRS